MKTQIINKDKKAILMPETLKIIIAVMCLVLLIYLIVSLYGILSKKTRLEQARASLELLSSEIQKVEKGEKQQSEFFLESPNDWWIIAWPYKNEGKKPEQCKEDYCICICDIPTGQTKDNALKQCDILGLCKDISIPIKTIYDASPENRAAKLTQLIALIFGKDVRNVPLDIETPLPLLVILDGGELLVIKTDKQSIDFNNRLALLRDFVSMPLKDSLVLGGIKDRFNEESKVFNLITVYCKEKEELDKQRLEETFNRHFKDFFEPNLKKEPLRAFFRLEIGCNKKVWGITSGGKVFFIGDLGEYDLKNQEVKEVIINIDPNTGFEMKLEDRRAGEVINAVKLITMRTY